MNRKDLMWEDASRCRTLRCGEAANPGPRRGVHLDRGTLEEPPSPVWTYSSPGSKTAQPFRRLVQRSVRSIGIDELFDKVPPFAGQCLRSYGDVLYQHGGALSNYRHCILALQRWKPICRPYMHGPWELSEDGNSKNLFLIALPFLKAL